MKGVSFVTFGCRQNQYDTERIREDFKFSGWKVVERDKKPDCIIVNTCSVTGSAERQARKLLNRLQREETRARIIMTGCYTRNNPDVGGKVEILASRKDIIEEFGLKESGYITEFAGHTKAFVSIQNGCDRFCSYCIVPYLRGRPFSRPKEDIEKEIKALISSGYSIFILTGINIGSYNYKGFDLLSLLKSLFDIEGVRFIGLSSTEPDTLDDGLIDLIKNEERFLRWLHICLQAGSDRILRLMGRRYTADDIKNLILTLKEIGDICIGTDVICGFPGEGEVEFEKTETLFASLPIDYFHVFRFSPREGTKAYSMQDRPPPYVARKRSQRLLQMSKEKFYRFKKVFQGREMEVLVEGRKIEDWLVGITSNYIKVFFQGPDSLMGKFARVLIKDVTREATYGELKK